MVKIFDASLAIVLGQWRQSAGGIVFTRLFLEHPRSVGESYLEHQRRAFGFGCSLFLAALACFVHAIVPGLFVRTGSSAIARLHDRMVVNRVSRGSGRGLPVQASQPLRP